jgi:hypothetical protein
MYWLLHAVEDDDRHWTCRRGQHVLDPVAGAHEHLDEAVEHLRDVARQIEGTFRMVLHFADGTTRTLEADG